MKSRVFLLAILCALLVQSCFPIGYDFLPLGALPCDGARTDFFVKNETQKPILVEFWMILVDPIDSTDVDDVPIAFLWTDDSLINRNFDATNWYVGYNLDPNGDTVKVMHINGGLLDEIEGKTCLPPSMIKQVGGYSIYSLEDTMVHRNGHAMSGIYFQGERQYIDYDAQQSDGVHVRELYLVISDSTLSLMEKDTTMLSRFAEYYGR